jgi:hypothetical protein
MRTIDPALPRIGLCYALTQAGLLADTYKANFFNFESRF